MQKVVALVLLVVLFISSCTLESDLVGKAFGTLQNAPPNFFCSFALQQEKHNHLCQDANPDSNGNPQITFDDDNDPQTPNVPARDTNAQRRQDNAEFYLESNSGHSTRNIQRQDQHRVRFGDQSNTRIHVVVRKPTDGNKKTILYKKGYYSTNHLVNGQRTWREVDLETSLLSRGVQRLNAFDSLLPLDDPNNPNSLWFDLGTANGELALRYTKTVRQEDFDTNEIALHPLETHFVLFMCSCVDCPNQGSWVCNPRYLDGTGQLQTFATGDFRWMLEKLSVEYNLCGNSIVDQGEQCDDGNNVDSDGCSAICETEQQTDFFTGRYYNDNGDGNYFTNLVFSREDQTIDFDWGKRASDPLGGTPDPRISLDDFSVVWEGSFNFNDADYEFSATADDGIRVYVDNQLIIDEWRNQAATTFTHTMSMTSGVHEVKVEYYERSGDAVAKVDWQIVNSPVNVCGNGVVESGETCDDGNTITESCVYGQQSCDVCDSSCQEIKGQTAYCSDGVINGNEECDDTNLVNGDGCSDSCTTESVAQAVCGNSVIESGENCDDGNTESGDGCSDLCQTELVPQFGCGDGNVDTGEFCDDGNNINSDACRNDCTACGDGVVQPGEQCDDGDQDNNDACLNTCFYPSCNDGIKNQDETDIDCGGSCRTDCENNFACSFNTDCVSGFCNNNICISPVCGDGVVQQGEQCDDGNQNSNDGCLNTCELASCGDGIIRTGSEQCDDGNQIDTDSCTNSCAHAICGDGIIRTGSEQCDDGNQDDTDGCTNACTINTCNSCSDKNGFVQECGTFDHSCVLIQHQCGSTQILSYQTCNGICSNGQCGQCTPGTWGLAGECQGFECTRAFFCNAQREWVAVE